MNDLIKMKELTAQLNTANRAYYQDNREIISNMEYDNMYGALIALEEKTGIILAGSPTQKVGYEVVSNLKKVPHEIPMLSLDKTKQPEALEDFLSEQRGLLSWKLDGLTILLKYENGLLVRALTRGNGHIGEDVTHNARVFANIPLTTPHKGKFDLRGEAVISIADFEEINEDEKYKNPRNLCSGAVRQLNSETSAKRRVLFYAFGLISSDKSFEKKSEQLEWLAEQGFEIAEFRHVNAQNILISLEEFKSKISTNPLMSDGLVLTYDDISYSESLGTTSKFPKDSIAFKWADEPVETTLLSIEWNTSRTGLVNPVAIFEPVDIEGTQVSRASLHNVSILRGLDLRPNDKITVYKANMIIPQVAENLSKSHRAEEISIPKICPVCGGITEIRQIENAPETLYCTNLSCDAQKIRALSHFVSRDALNIAGLSEQTLEKFVNTGIVTNFTDLFVLANHENQILQMEGFGQKSYEKLQQSIETAKDVSLPNFIHALGIRHVGLANAKLLCTHFNHDAEKIADTSKNHPQNLLEIKGFGEAIAQSLNEYFSQEKNIQLFTKALEFLRIKIPTTNPNTLPLSNLTFVITGELTRHKNRAELQALIEENGGRVTGSVTAKTSFLINNDANSPSSKNKKAAQLSVPILTEDDFLARFII
ncbi:MAG: NAD-dependent DNA ligase LigA [Defluviitaleaceae bacterium]|nr:NAD-dependent DNA ligase LigA [Defluviitaleaceae bacterium]